MKAKKGKKKGVAFNYPFQISKNSKSQIGVLSQKDFLWFTSKK